MMTRTILALAALIATPGLTQVVENQPSETPPSANQAADSAISDLGTLGSDVEHNVPKVGTWASLPDTTRHLLIMGTADGFSAAGAGAPCFPGQNNASLDQELMKTGFGARDSNDLPAALARLSAPTEQCQNAPKRGYDSSLIASMSDEHLSHYLSGVVRGYAHIKSCPTENHSYAGSTIAAAIFSATTPASPPQVLAPALVVGCAGPVPVSE